MSGMLAQLEAVAEAYLPPLGVRILVAIAIFYVGRLIARQLVRGLDRLMETSRLEVSLRKFLRDIAYALMLVAIVIAALDAIGVETTAVVAVLGAAGLAIGLALQGSLSNFAAGVMLIVLRPYKVGDLVSIGKYAGRVDAIRVFHTIVITADNREVIIPNGQIITQPLDPLKQLLERVVLGDDRVLAAPPPAIEVTEVGDASIKLAVRPWAIAADHAAVAATTMERLRAELAAAGHKFTIVQQ